MPSASGANVKIAISADIKIGRRRFSAASRKTARVTGLFATYLSEEEDDQLGNHADHHRQAHQRGNIELDSGQPESA